MINVYGYQLTQEQFESINGKFIALDTFASPLTSTSGELFIVLSDEDKLDLYADYYWLLELPYKEFEFENELPL
jgi:hypothetical protein